MTAIDTIIAQVLEEPGSVLGALNDLVTAGRMNADAFVPDDLATLQSLALVKVLFVKAPNQPLRAYAYPSDLGLQLFATLEREADRL